MNAPLKTSPTLPAATASQGSPGSHPALFQAGSIRLHGQGMLFVVVLMAIAVVAVIALVKWVWGVALGFLQILLVTLKIGAILISAVLLVLIILGAVRWIHLQREHQRAERQILRACPVPRASVIREEEEPRSHVERTMNAVVRHELIEHQGRDPSALSDFDVAEFLLDLPEILRQPVYMAILERHIIQPCFVLLVEENPFLVAQIERYGQLRQRVPFSELRRLVHVLSANRLGLSPKAVWQTQEIGVLRADYRAFCIWFMRYGIALLSRIEPLLENALLKVGAGRMQNAISSGASPTEQDRARAAHLIETCEQVLHTSEPWLAPRVQLEELEHALDEARLLALGHPSLGPLMKRVKQMQRRLENFEVDYDQALKAPPERSPFWLDEAYMASADQLTDENLKGHAARLYLTRVQDEAFEASERADDSASSTATNAEPIQGDSDSCVCSDSGLDPEAASQAHTLF